MTNNLKFIDFLLCCDHNGLDWYKGDEAYTIKRKNSYSFDVYFGIEHIGDAVYNELLWGAFLAGGGRTFCSTSPEAVFDLMIEHYKVRS